MTLVLIVFVLFAIAAGLAAVLAAMGRARWGAETKDLRDRIEHARLPSAPTRFDVRALDGVPEVVATYLRGAIDDGRPIALAARFSHRGTFLRGEGRWAPFTSDQRVVTRRPGFDWDARIALAPGVAMHVHDAYAEGEGRLHAAVLGLVTVAKSEGGDELAAGELMRYLAEAVWIPTALLPSAGLQWSPIDATSARATLSDGAHTVSLEFGFGDDGGIESVTAAARPRMVGGTHVPTPWRGRVGNRARRAGMVIPRDAEVAWQLPEGVAPYWRGHLTRIDYEDAR